MPRRKGSTRVCYRESDSDSEDLGPGSGMLGALLGLLMSAQNKSARKAPRKKNTTPRAASKSSSKRKSATCDCPHCPKKRSRTKSNKKSDTTQASTSKASLTSKLSFDSDDEEPVDTTVKQTHENKIKSSVDTFFKSLESDDDDDDKLFPIKGVEPEKKGKDLGKDFYTITSDESDDEKAKCKKEENVKVTYEKVSEDPKKDRSPSDDKNPSNSILSIASKAVSAVAEKKTEDLFALVDDILNDCDIVDITHDKPKENVPIESLDDLKKKTDEILGGVTSLIDSFKPKPDEKKAPGTPEKQIPTCPVCLENLGGAKPAMVTICGHMFCDPCISQVAKTLKKCPTCREKVTKNKYHPIYI